MFFKGESDHIILFPCQLCTGTVASVGRRHFKERNVLTKVFIITGSCEVSDKYFLHFACVLLIEFYKMVEPLTNWGVVVWQWDCICTHCSAVINSMQIYYNSTLY